MKQNILKAVIIILIAAIPAGSIFAQKMKGRDRVHGGKRLLQELNLTQEQQDQIAKLRLDNQKKMVDLKADVAQTRLQIKEELMQKEPNEGKVIDLTKKVSSLQSQMKENAISMWFKTYRLLDDKQKEVFKKAAPGLMERGGDGMMRRFNKKGLGQGLRNG